MNTENASALPAERQLQIHNYIVAAGSAQIKELAKRFDVSEVTIRRDLVEVERMGQIHRTHGGAIAYSNNTTFEKAHSDKMLCNIDEKERIGRYAADLVLDGDTIILDSGTTASAMAHNLSGKQGITVITNDLYIAIQARLDPSSTLIVTPGVRLDRTNVLVGYYVEDFLKRVNVNKFFMTADAVNRKTGISNANILEIGLKQMMIAASQETILIADSSKFEKQAMLTVTPVSGVDMIITDSGMREEVAAQYRKAVPELVIV